MVEALAGGALVATVRVEAARVGRTPLAALLRGGVRGWQLGRSAAKHQGELHPIDRSHARRASFRS